MCLNIPLDKNKGGQQSVGADIITIAKQVGFKYHATIIWNEGNISRRTAWGSWQSASAPYVIAPVELIVVLYKQKWQKRSGGGKSDVAPAEFVGWTNGMWTFSGESKKRAGHPAPFPIEMPRRCIKLFSFVGDTVLDPFAGSGATLIMAAMLNRVAIGVEIDAHSLLRVGKETDFLRPRVGTTSLASQRNKVGRSVIGASEGKMWRVSMRILVRWILEKSPKSMPNLHPIYKERKESFRCVPQPECDR